MPHWTLSTRNDYERKINYDWPNIERNKKSIKLQETALHEKAKEQLDTCTQICFLRFSNQIDLLIFEREDAFKSRTCNDNDKILFPIRTYNYNYIVKYILYKIIILIISIMFKKNRNAEEICHKCHSKIVLEKNILSIIYSMLQNKLRKIVWHYQRNNSHIIRSKLRKLPL